jgi:nucleotide-binding universal stress UspA family protein
MENGSMHSWGNPNTILVATNLHDMPHLMPHAIAQAKMSAARVVLVHAIEPSYLHTGPGNGLPFVLPSSALHSVQEELNRIAKRFQHEGILCEPIALKGLPKEQIPTLVCEREIGRVIVGTRSAKALDRILRGSVAEDLLHALYVPVCVIGPHVAPQIPPDWEPKFILAAVSLHQRIHLSGKLALELANFYQSRLTLLHVIPSHHASEEEHRHLRHQRSAELSIFLREKASLWCTPTPAIREGDPAQSILAEAQASCADLIVLGVENTSRTLRFFRSGVVHSVVAKARVPVIALQESQMTQQIAGWAIA